MSPVGVNFNFLPLPPDQEGDDLLLAAGHALRSYQYGNASPDLAEEIADRIDEFFKEKDGR